MPPCSYPQFDTSAVKVYCILLIAFSISYLIQIPVNKNGEFPFTFVQNKIIVLVLSSLLAL